MLSYKEYMITMEKAAMTHIFTDAFFDTSTLKKNIPTMPYMLDGDSLLRKSYQLFHKASDIYTLSHGARSILFFLIGDLVEMKRKMEYYSLSQRLLNQFRNESAVNLSRYTVELINNGILLSHCIDDMRELFDTDDE